MDQRTGATPGEVDTIWTIPNLFTLLRLLCLPLFLWLLFGLPSRQAAAWLLGGLGATDWVDGYLARGSARPASSARSSTRPSTASCSSWPLIAIMINGAMPIWFGVAVLVREVVVGGDDRDRDAVLRHGALRRHLARQAGDVPPDVRGARIPHGGEQRSGADLFTRRRMVPRHSRLDPQLLHRDRVHPEDLRRGSARDAARRS